MSDADMEESLTTVVGVGAIMKDKLIEAYSIGTGIDPIWNLDRIDQCSLPLDGNSFKEDASNVKVFIMDSGIRADHEEFVGMINPNDACHFSYPFRNYQGVPTPTPPLVDVNGHGTHVAGTVCGHKYGVSSNCQICSVKVLYGSIKLGGSWTASLAGLNHIADYCTANPGTRCVVNMSLGSDTNAFFNAEIERYIAAGLVIVAAAGNDNDDACNYSPASATSAIAVGATTKNDARWTDFKSSNFGSCVDVWAPGAEIKSANFSNVNGYSLMNGTSMAAPRKFILVL
jgi:subtilisin family serine protease